MKSNIESFRASIADAKALISLFQHLVNSLRLPGDYSDLLRMAVVYSMSALDKLAHDIIIYEMVETYSARRPSTPKYDAEVISMANHAELTAATMPPAEQVFEAVVRAKLAHQSFMDPAKLADGLALVWAEKHKWHAIAMSLGRNDKQLRTELKNLFARRNAIVHEADKDPSSGQKLTLDVADAERAAAFVSTLGEKIYVLVVRRHFDATYTRPGIGS